MLVLAVFGGRLVQLQGLDASAIAATALSSRLRDRVLPAHRGTILDSRGATLATTVERRNITVDQNVVPAYRDQDPTAGPADKGVLGAAPKLAPLLGMSLPAMTRALSGTDSYVILAKGVEPRVWGQVSQLKIPGVMSEQAGRRNYPAGQVGANVIGFLNSSGTPQGGIESSQAQLLKGIDGSVTFERGRNGQPIATGLTTHAEPVSGRDVQLTIDADLQWKTQELLLDKVRETGAESGQAVVMDPRTGAVLALVSVPTFDPNAIRPADQKNLQDRALTDIFEPGSTSKVITAAAALEEGAVTPSTRLAVDDTIRRGGRTFHDSHSHGREQLTFAGVLAQSSNVGTIRVGEKLPSSTIYDYLRKFGLGSPTGVQLRESGGILAPVADWSNSQRYTVLFGQGLSVTALQSASVFATIANDGVRVSPTVIKAVTGADGQLDPVPAPHRIRVISQNTATQLRTMLEKVVGDDGTAVQATVPGYRVAGKTGTAQRYDDSCGCYRGYTASFVGMAPADAPRLVVAVYLQKPVRNYYGGSSAAPVFQKVMTYGLARLGIEPTGTKPPDVPLTWK
jgi:cell division protein FtsI (penicillin-binding protein 3)